MLSDRQKDRSDGLIRNLTAAGCDVVYPRSSSDSLQEAVAECRPDVVIIEQDAPGRDTLESMQRATEHIPHPVVMYVDDSAHESIRKAIQVGVAAYVFKDLGPERVRPVLDIAIARFEEHQRLMDEAQDLRDELGRARHSLAERRLVEQAKGIVMREYRVDEDRAYDLLRQISQDRNVAMGDLARLVIRNHERKA